MRDRQQPPRPQEGQQRHQEDDAERDPDRRPGDRPPEGALVAAGHHPGDLRAGAHLGDLAALVRDEDLGLDGLLAVRVLAHRVERVEALAPRRSRSPCARCRGRRSSRAASPERPGDRLDLVVGEARLARAGRRRERRPDLAGLLRDGVDQAGGGGGRLGGRGLADRARGGGGRGAGGGGEGQGRQQRDDGSWPHARYRKDQRRLSRKFTGMTAAIAMAWAGTSGLPARTSSSSSEQVEAERHQAHGEVPRRPAASPTGRGAGRSRTC